MLTRLSRIPMVDNSSTSRKVVMGMLERFGCVNLEEASDGSEALGKLARVR